MAPYVFASVIGLQCTVCSQSNHSRVAITCYKPSAGLNREFLGFVYNRDVFDQDPARSYCVVKSGMDEF